MPPRIDRSLRLPAGEFFPTAAPKTGIALHHTVGGSARSTFDWWVRHRRNGDGRAEIVGTAYLIERDGTIFEIFSAAAWAWQFGLGWAPARRIAFEQRFIGIELASEGGLIEADGQLYAFDRVSPKTLKPRSEAFDHGVTWRGYRWFDAFEPAQLDALVDLVCHLCDTFAIPKRIPEGFLDYYGEDLADFQGVIGHSMVRRDKSDPAPMEALWERLVFECGLAPTAVTPRPRQGPAALPQDQLDALFAHNVRQIDRLDLAAGSMVKGLLMELERRNMYLRLADAPLYGTGVRYELVQGNRDMVGRLARALGFVTVTDTRLEARHARAA